MTALDDLAPLAYFLLVSTVYGVIRDLQNPDGLWQTLLNHKGSVEELKEADLVP